LTQKRNFRFLLHGETSKKVEMKIIPGMVFGRAREDAFDSKAPSRIIFRIFYLISLESISFRNMAMASSTVMVPMTSPLRVRTFTVPFSTS